MIFQLNTIFIIFLAFVLVSLSLNNIFIFSQENKKDYEVNTIINYSEKSLNNSKILLTSHDGSISYYANISKKMIEVWTKEKLEKERIQNEIRINEELRIKQEIENKKKLEEEKKTKLANLPPKIGSKEEFMHLIREKCNIKNCDSELVIKVMFCESGGISNATNGVNKGLFQYADTTFYANSKKIGITDPNIWNPYHQIDVTTHLFSQNSFFHWKNCVYR